MSKPNLQVLDYLASKGVRFVIPEGESSHSGYFVGREEVEEFLDDPDEFFAKQHGVTKAEYRDWREAGGAVRCSATTRKGKQCNNFVKTPYNLTAQGWLALQGHYCVIHTEGVGVPGLRARA